MRSTINFVSTYNDFESLHFIDTIWLISQFKNSKFNFSDYNKWDEVVLSKNCSFEFLSKTGKQMDWSFCALNY